MALQNPDPVAEEQMSPLTARLAICGEHAQCTSAFARGGHMSTISDMDTKGPPPVASSLNQGL